MIQLKVGIHLPSLRAPLLRSFALAAEMGADAVEIDARWQLKPGELTQTALRQLRKTLADYRLRVCAVSFRTRRGYNVPQDLDARVNGTKEAMRMARELGASVVVNHVGHIPAEPQGAEWNLLVQVLTDLGRHGQHVGAILAAQTGSVDSADLARLITALPDGSMGVDLDPGQLIVNGSSAQEAAEKLGAHVMHVHATDGARDLARGRGLGVPLGRGSVDYPALLAVLEERNYRGYFTVQRDSTDNPAVEIGHAVKYLRSL
jgi:sugar phosphate isomerase/epimerase